MGLGFSQVESQEPRIDDTIIKSRRRAKMGSQFENWSIEDVQETLERFQCYKDFKFTGLDSTRTKLLTQWPEFYDVMEYMSRKKARQELVEQRKAMHPGCRAYAMVRDPESRFPPPLPSSRSDLSYQDDPDRGDGEEEADNYDDVSDDASETAGITASADELSSNISDDSDEEGKTVSPSGKKTKRKRKKDRKKKRNAEGEEERDGDGAVSGEDSDDRSGSELGSGMGSESEGSDLSGVSEADSANDLDGMEDDLEAEIRAKYNDTSPLRPDWDIRTRNPVFFGYLTTSVAEVDAKELAQREAEKKAEKEDAKNAQSEELEELLEEIKVEMDGINGRREARRKKRDKELAGRERMRKRREKELEEARKMYDDGEFRSYEVTWQAEEDSILDNEAVADAKYEIKAEEQDTKWDKIEQQLQRKESALREETRLLASRPRGEKFVRRSRRKLEKLQKDLQVRTQMLVFYF